MKLLLPLLLAAGLLAPPAPPASPAPECTATLTLPDSALQLSTHWRQVARDVAAFSEGTGLDAMGLKALRVRAVLVQGATLRSDVQLSTGDVVLPAGNRPIGFTVGPGGAPHFFAVTGESAVDLPSQEIKAGFDSPTLLLQWVWVDRTQVWLQWHIGDRAGAIVFQPGLPGPKQDVPAPQEPAPQTPPGGTPRGG
jgi:hypothetical protein